MKTVSKEEWMVFRVDASAFVFISLSLSLSFEEFRGYRVRVIHLFLSLSLSLSSSSFVTAQRRRGRRGWSRSTESNGWKNNSKRYVFIKHPCPSNEPRVITHTPLAPQASKPETKSYSRSLAVKPCVSTKVRKRKSSSYSETRRFSGYYRTNKKSTRTA